MSAFKRKITIHRENFFIKERRVFVKPLGSGLEAI